MKKELLAPAGNMECLKQAVNNGADAVYLAGKNYGARKFAQNFSDEELMEAVEYAHIYGVKIYVTVNTIVYEDEMVACLEYIEFLYNINVDAIIVQDIGLIKRIKEVLPNMEIHASTQAHTHNINQIKELESLGVKRVVLAREMSLDEINSLDTDMELEIFVHGALCISYSGQCLYSSGVLNRSGNRGECAGLCRIPYNLYEEDKLKIKDKYLLSPKEFNSTSYIENIKKSKAYSLKIEGRMKSPVYVGYVVRLYRKLLDNDNYVLSEEEVFNLKSLYNRGFTKGYLNGASDKDFISLNSSNHQGVEIGEVIDLYKNKVKIKLSHELNQGDAVRFPNGEGMYVNFLYDEKDRLVKNVSKNNICLVDNKVNLKVLGKIYLTVNKKLEDELGVALPKKVNVHVYCYMHAKKNLIVRYSDGLNEIEYIGNVVDKAKSVPLTKDRIEEILGKLGNTPFKMVTSTIDVSEDAFMSVGKLNEIRRDLVQQLIDKRIGKTGSVKMKSIDVNYKNKSVDKYYISALARNEEQLQTLIDNKVDYIYVSDKALYDKYKRDNVYLRLERVNMNHENYDGDNLLIGELGGLSYTANNVVASDYYLNVVNNSYIDFLNCKGVKRVTLSPELTIDRINLLNNFGGDLELIVYGSLEYMIMKYNFIENMRLDSKAKYYLEDKAKRKFQIFRDDYTHLLSDKKIDLIDGIKFLRNSHVNTFRLELWDETRTSIEKLISKIRNICN